MPPHLTTITPWPPVKTGGLAPQLPSGVAGNDERRTAAHERPPSFVAATTGPLDWTGLGPLLREQSHVSQPYSALRKVIPLSAQPEASFPRIEPPLKDPLATRLQWRPPSEVE